MENLFHTILRMSGTAALVILAVLLARLVLRKAPKIFSYALWAVVLFRLLCPVSVSTGFSLLPAVQTQPAGEERTTVHIHTGIMAMNSRVNDYFAGHPYPVEYTPVEREGDLGAVYLEEVSRMVETASPDWTAIACRVWLAGTSVLLGYSLLSTLRLRRKLAASIPLSGDKNVRLADHIPSPFVLGLLRPSIYLPSDLPEAERDYILLHERTHIRRGDHLFRALAWLALALHWFNPLVWLAFHLAGKDMEMSCDEAVLRKMGRDVRADYSSSLLRLSAGKRLPAGPLAFGDGDPKSRIKNVLNYKKPALWVIAAALIAVLCAGAALATNPGSSNGPGKPADFVFHEPGAVECWLDYLTAPESMPWDDSAETELPEFPGVTFRWTWGEVFAVTEDGELTLFTGMPIWSVYFCDLNGDGYRELCASVSYGSGMIDEHILVFDYCHRSLHELWDRGVRDYTLKLAGDRLWAVEQEYPMGKVLRAGPLVMTESGLDIQNEFTGISLPDAELTFSLEEGESGPIVRMEGSVDGVPLRRNAVWWAQGLDTLFGGHSGGLSMSWQFDDSGAEVNAWWADDGHTSVTLSTKMSAMLSSLANTGWWEFTVDLATGTVTEMASYPLWAEGLNDETHMYPEILSNGTAVSAARAAAKLITEAENYYAQAVAGGLDGELSFSMDTDDDGPFVRITGSVDGVTLTRGAFWYPQISEEVRPDAELWLMYPPFTDGIEGLCTAWWANEEHTAVTMSTAPMASLSSYSGACFWSFTVELTPDGGVVTEMATPASTPAQNSSEIEPRYYPASISDEDAVKAARIAAKLMTAGEDFFRNGTQDAPAPDLARYTSSGMGCSFSYDPLLFKVNDEIEVEFEYGTDRYLSIEPIEAKTLDIFFAVQRVAQATVEERIAWLRNNQNLNPGQENVTIGAEHYPAVKLTWAIGAENYSAFKPAWRETGYAVGEHYLTQQNGAVYEVTISSYPEPSEELLAGAQAALDSLSFDVPTPVGSIPFGAFPGRRNPPPIPTAPA